MALVFLILRFYFLYSLLTLSVISSHFSTSELYFGCFSPMGDKPSDYDLHQLTFCNADGYTCCDSYDKCNVDSGQMMLDAKSPKKPGKTTIE